MIDEMKNDLREATTDSSIESTNKQSARCLLREKFLRAVTGVVGKECVLHMYSNTNVSGVYKGNDIEFETLLVEQLKTPFSDIPSAKIRSLDVNYIDFEHFASS